MYPKLIAQKNAGILGNNWPSRTILNLYTSIGSFMASNIVHQNVEKVKHEGKLQKSMSDLLLLLNKTVPIHMSGSLEQL